MDEIMPNRVKASRTRPTDRVSAGTRKERSILPSGAVLTETKLQAPRARKGLVSRDRLVARILAAGDARLALIQAPAGSGKTTLLSEWRGAPGGGGPLPPPFLPPPGKNPGRFLG